jgi:uncharacterized SAM-binding protein YcdF (DUF218 family)
MREAVAALAQRTDVVVVLGAMLAAPGVPGPALSRRVEHGVEVFLRLKAGHLLVSGGLTGPPPAEAVLMRGLALAKGIPEERIVVEDRARNTFENALYSGRVIRAHGWRRVVVVTDGFHLRRALFVFRKLGLSVRGEGVPKPRSMSIAQWYRLHLGDCMRLAGSAYLFWRGAHHARVAAADG